MGIGIPSQLKVSPSDGLYNKPSAEISLESNEMQWPYNHLRVVMLLLHCHPLIDRN